MQRKLIAHSWDFDGMLASPLYVEKLGEIVCQAAKEKRALTHQDYVVLADFIVEQYYDFFDNKLKDTLDDEHVVFIGSDRQDVMTDLNNSMKVIAMYFTLSCYPFFPALIDSLKKKYKNLDIRFDGLLLQDIYSQTNPQPGMTHQKACQYWLGLNEERISRLASLYDLAAAKNAAEQQLRVLKPDESVKRDHIEAHIKTIDAAINKSSKDANNLFFEFKKELLELIGSKPPKYTDKQKFLIMYAQMHHTMSTYARGRKFEYRYADDRYDILTSAEECLAKMALFLPLGTEITIGQYIPPDIRKTLIKLSTDNLFNQFTQKLAITGLCERNDDLRHIFSDINSTHNILNVQYLELVPDTLARMVNFRQRDKIVAKLMECVDYALSLSVKKAQGLKHIKSLLNEALNTKTPDEFKKYLENIKKAAAAKLDSKVADGPVFFQKSPKLAYLYHVFSELDSTNTDLKKLSEALASAQSMESSKNTLPTLRRSGLSKN